MTTNDVTIGIDLGDRKHSACVLSARGEIVAETEITNTRECLTAFARQHRGATFVMETGPHSPWVARLLESRGHTVHVANARKRRAISTSAAKFDREIGACLGLGPQRSQVDGQGCEFMADAR